MLHHIQGNILDQLATASTRRYGELKPSHLDGNVFNYHLKQLISGKYVIKSLDGDYSLTAHGKDYIVHRYEDPLEQAHSIFLIALNRGDDWLMRERLVHPVLGMVGFIHGEPQASEPLLVTAHRRLKEKTGIETDLSLHSSGLIRIMRDGACESFSHAIILKGTTQDTFSITSDATGSQHWYTKDQLTQSQVLPSCTDIVTRIDRGDQSPFDLTYDIGNA
jgi:hypothetical protein